MAGRRRRARLCGGALLGLLVLPRALPSSFAAAKAPRGAPAARTGAAAAAALAPGFQTAEALFARRHRSTGRGQLSARRIFDSGSFFGVGISEATVIALLGWFLLGPEELFKLAKQAGNWLGELRTFVGQAARQYESALDDESTRKAIEGIRQTQRTVSEISDSWRSVTDTFRNPLALGSSIDAAYTKYSDGKKTKEGETDAKADGAKAEGAKADKAKGLPTLESGEPEAVATKEGVASKELGPSGALEETAEELEAKRKAADEAVSDMWFKGTAAAVEADDGESRWSPEKAAAVGRSIDARMAQLEDLQLQLAELTEGVLQDRDQLRELLDARDKVEPPAEAPLPQPEKAPLPEPEKASAVPARGVEA